MSKRLQVLMPEDEYRALVTAARLRGQPVARLVRDSLRQTLMQETGPDPDRRIASVLRFARFAGPTGDITQLLAEIERGRNIA